MAIWTTWVVAEEKFRYLNYLNDDDVETVINLDGRPVLALWQPFSVEIVTEDGELVSDFPYLSGAGLVVSERAKEVLEPIIAGEVEFLPLQCAQTNFWIVNIINMLDCLDHSSSQFTHWRDGGIRVITKYVFDPQCVRSANVFTLLELPHGPRYVSDAFKAMVEDNHLIGLDFRKVWE